ncbi:hypothetical protein HAQ01_04045 [Acidithiobacillus thiooxidans]|uniref:hypothetical protein n=1 Tax=Acidithiobacillus thiooxidans TaxID=930 RepID=UPI001C071C45|nr:hypothetical protein [Acidithiobacillus thiooxidans]MBU2792597.1 hypothetical protein [Acidithiobacillus thiooxidans]
MSMVADRLVHGDLPEMQHLLRLMIADPSFKADVRKMVDARLAREDLEMEGRPKYNLVQTWLERN